MRGRERKGKKWWDKGGERKGKERKGAVGYRGEEMKEQRGRRRRRTE